ncbi:hypothetical protein [Bacillus phage Hakuna]|uniref:Uncharacterized protein n=1 Tax=Bacillus phage Hakuna TaxID=1486659 RepID=A0A024B1A5_9CAUD|nr:hypothetical protein FP72_gp197 [Bacillus phage Hakuna]AHZ10215.1 hypothetical protein [Bacillus phage Hakuna]ULF49408.1 hypothetical protein [Bacillus phage MrBubbles]
MSTKTLTVREAIAYMRRAAEFNEDVLDMPLQIVMNEPSLGARVSVGVKGLTMGIDWDYGRFMITPQEGLVRKSKIR